MSTESLPEIPSAVTVPVHKKRTSAVWFLTLACAALSIGLIYNSYRNQGEIIEIEFEQGYGLQPADAVRFRGIEIGRIEKIDLRTNPPGVIAMVRLTPSARAVVTEGTRFWIARPIVTLESIRGLETVIGPKYIAMEPGKSGTGQPRRFIGLEAPPPIDPSEGSVEIVLDSKRRHGLTSGAPILHRGFRVGDVLRVDLASDARSVIMRAAIDPEYHELVRSNSKFWVRSGWRLDLGLSGIRLNADSMSEILNGGIEFATPDGKGNVATTGARFELHDEPEDEWLAWQPSLPYGALWENAKSKTPQAHRVALRWKEKSFGFTVDRQRMGWGLLLDDGSLVCRDDVCTPPKGAIEGSGFLEVAGSVQKVSNPIASSRLSDDRQFVKVILESKSMDPVGIFESRNLTLTPLGAANTQMPQAKEQQERAPVDLLIVGPEPSSCLVLDAGRLTKVPGGWQISTGIDVPDALDSAPVLELASGRCLGCVSLQRDKPIIAILDTRST
ncbi:MAG: MlaD family protein [Pirellula sp.]|nr:MlaD family protein [Pirellula sp.]